MKKLIWIICLGILYSCSATSHFLTGSYTDNENGNGIHLISFNHKNGSVEIVKSFAKVHNPSYFTLSKDENYLYSVNENAQTTDSVTVFEWNFKNQSLDKIQQISAFGSAPCHITQDRSGQFIVISNYLSGNIVLYRVLPNHQLSEPVQDIKLQNFSTDSHAHMAYFSKNNRTLFVTDLGNDRLYQFKFDENKISPISESPIINELPKGFGPRHFVFDKHEKFLYLLNEWKAKISVFEFNNGNLIEKQTINSTDFPNNAENKGSAAIKISKDGKILYASNRGESNSISIFKIENGRLTKLNEIKTDLHPRDFTIDKTGKFLMVAARDSNSITVYNIKENFKKAHQLKMNKPVFLLEL